MSRPDTVTRTWRVAHADCSIRRAVGAELARPANTPIAAGAGAGAAGAVAGATGGGITVELFVLDGDSVDAG